MAEFFRQGLAAAREAVLDVRAQAGLHLAPVHVTKRLRARVRGRLKAIETIVRRLIFLMAAALELPPLPPVRTGGEAVSAAPPPPAPGGGVEDVTESFRAVLGPVCRLRLLGRRAPCLMEWPEVFAGKGGAQTRDAGPVLAAPLIARIAALHRLLKTPDAAAKRLARHLAGLKVRREPPPVCPPMPGLFRLGAELGVVAAALPGLVSRAVADWPDTS